jgi:hypothetical protein
MQLILAHTRELEKRIVCEEAIEALSAIKTRKQAGRA